MPTQRFIIAPFDTGLQDNIKPWIIPDDAFSSLRNAYVYRGRVRKRFGSRLLVQGSAIPQLESRLRVLIGETNGSGDFPATTVPGAVFEAGQMFSCGDVLFTVTATGATLVAAPGRTTTATGDYIFAPPTFEIAGSDAMIAMTPVYFYPAQPVMGLLTFETNEINDDLIIGFDTQFAYEYVLGGWERLSAEVGAGDATWTGSDSQFFSGTTSYGTKLSDPRFFVVNFNAADGIRNLNAGATLAGSPWDTVAYVTTGSDTLDSGKIAIVFKSRLLILNTLETVSAAPQNFQNRVRFSQLGDLVSAANTFSEATGRGGFVDAPTKEVIVSARIIKDRLIVFFERSTWELVWQSNEINPFAFQKIDSELGAESSFASVIVKDDIIGVGNVGIHACNGGYVRRIDQKIPNDVFEIHNENSGVDRVYGIRDFEAEMIYWTFPDSGRFRADADPVYPNRVLVFNYVNGSWAFNDDSITCFGYFQPQNDITWAMVTIPWEGWEEPWNSGDFQALTRTVIAGNQEGFTFLINKDLPSNAPALQITDITIVVSRPRLRVFNHNFVVGEFIRVESCLGNTTLNDTIYQIVQIVDSDNIEVVEPAFTGTPTYEGGGLIRRISRIEMDTKEFNFFVDKGMNCFVPRVDFLVDKSDNGQFTVDARPSSSQLTTQTFTMETSPYSLYPIEQYQTRLWHPLYVQIEGTGAQLRIYLNDDQMRDFDVIRSDLQINAFVFYAMPSSSRLQS